MKRIFMPFVTKAMVIVVMVLSACAPDIQSHQYSASQVGRAGDVTDGTVVSVRNVVVRQSANQAGVGTLAGAVAGGVAGSHVGGGTGQALATLGGGILGGVLGSRAEQSANAQRGCEYIVKQKNGKKAAVTQGCDDGFRVGSKVSIIRTGGRARIVPR